MTNLKTDTFDVLIVYSELYATSAASQTATYPFALNTPQAQYNHSYEYLLETCAQAGVKAALTTSADIVDSGLCSSYWQYINGQWIKTPNPCFAKVILDKFAPTTQKLKLSRELMFKDSQIKPFNDPYLYQLFKDKLMTYHEFPDITIPTVLIMNNDRKQIEQALLELQHLIAHHPHKIDFGQEIILKDRFGLDGVNIYKIDHDPASTIQQLTAQNHDTTFVIQPFTLFDQGYQYQELKRAFDIRLIFLGQKIIQTFMRMAKKGDFRCNIHQGGTLIAISPKDIPENLMSCAQNLTAQINKPHALYALDFIISNHNHVYFLEGNCSPGINWTLGDKENERLSKELINCICQELKNRVQSANT